MHLIIILNIQFSKSDIYKIMSNKQYKKIITVQSPRGLIYDTNGLLLAGNKKMKTLFCCPSEVIKNREVLIFFQKNYPAVYKKIIINSSPFFCYIEKFIEDKFLIKLLQENSFLKGYVHSFDEYKRYYPSKESIPVIGFSSIDNEGISGIEYQFNNFFKKKTITKSLFCDAKKKIIDESCYKKTISKNSLCLSIDSHLQALVTELIKNRAIEYGSKCAFAIIMDGETGKIDALAVYPFIESEELLDCSLLNNYAISGAYEMGSVIKAFCMLAALEEKVVTPEEEINCFNTKSYFLNNIKINTFKPNGKISYKDVIKESNNIGTAQVAMRLGPKLYDHYKKMGFAAKTGIEFPGEALGFINPPAKWSRHSILSLSYGYEIMTTLIQLVRAWSLFTTDGYLLTPSLLKNSIVKKTEKLYSSEAIANAKIILEKNIMHSKELVKNLSGYNLFGKTGTAELLENGLYNKNRNSYSFIGHIESNKHKKIIGIHLRENKYKNIYSAEVTFPLFCQIAKLIIFNKSI